MLTKDLIKLLQDKLERDKEYEEIMGESEIMIDCFVKTTPPGSFHYGGFSPEIIIERSDDGVYEILSGFKRE